LARKVSFKNLWHPPEALTLISVFLLNKVKNTLTFFW